MQYESSLLHEADVIVTRNGKDFKDFAGNVLGPEEFLDSIWGNVGEK